ncbi:biopolymer transporter ExbD [Limnoraphis robusta]|uniref:Biopolymer transporter ExbD n=1 Tax=Limnoraphis robusta CCNP1315 TaxID=3110306 RepID=A0ABU5TVH5_9CYAN|nr:biopolymer transporter ExbD [Limnoraphis robusta]MEA5498675.1 biopolymer transporter ExbD [Limnoraphis robusta BA-68 BA1]MEA5517963.1 biopolymer transporter ExbD [Limnoraphis robusta CCNP1315]MEA5549064.1 biopolymer transporter ExbD [Limnoraphis robusta CCNP1324]
MINLMDDEADRPAEINIVPMIDVIFSILAFFIISSLFLTRSEGLPVNLPKASTSQQQQTEQIAVTIDSEGKVALNRESLAVQQLEQEVRKLIPGNETRIVILNADEAVNHGTVVEVMDQIRRVEGAKLAIATKKPDSPGEN